MKRIIATFLLLFLFISVNGQSNKSPIKEVYISKTPKPTAPARLIVSKCFFKDNGKEKNEILDAYENNRFTCTIVNKGEGDAFSMTAEIKLTGQIEGLVYPNEIQLGNLKSNESMILDIPISGTRNLESGRAEFEVIIVEGNKFNADPFIFAFDTQAFKNPQVVIADYKFSTDAGGRVKLGQVISMSFAVQNRGQGDAMDINVRFIVPENVYPVRESQFKIVNLSPNESKYFTYEFFANKGYVGNEISVKIDVSESYNKYGEAKELTVLLDQSVAKTQLINVTANYKQKVAIEDISLTSDVDKNIPLSNIYYDNKFALIIGNEDYTSYQQGLSNEMDVQFASNDALVFKKYCTNTFGIPEKNITLLINATAGKMAQAMDKMNKLIQATHGMAEITVYYAGHGLPDESTKKPYLIPVDVNGGNLSSAIKLSFLYEKLTEHPAKQVTVFLDACFSGGGRNAGLLESRGVNIKPKEDKLEGNIIVFTASSGEESSLAWKDKQHGMFTYFLLKKFQETGGDFSYAELDDYLKDKIGLESVRTNSKSQNPQVLFGPEALNKWRKWKL